jgi:putative membrane-bound dehydrogenase-like protein
MRLPALPLALTALALTAAARPDGNRLTYLDGVDPYYVGLNSPKLVTPQWVGEDGVEAVVVLAIDDMRDNAPRYEAVLRPVLDRLKAIDGRAPVSIMTCSVRPDDPRLQGWLKEGLNIDVHTRTHPCPLLQKGDFAAAQKTVDDCIKLLNTIPGNRPVAFRMPCCDSRNTLSPRFFSEIFNWPRGSQYLTIDSSVFQVFTPADPSLPRSLVEDPDGGERYRKYIPSPSFVNTIENYPYPYVIGGLCWEFPCMVPSDWEAQHVQKPNNPRTVEDMKAALDAVVLKQGVFNLVFHPHNWIKPEQVVELIDHAVKKHGKKVKFLNFREAQARIDQNLLAGEPLRDKKGSDNGVRVLDLNNDGFMDVVIGNDRKRETRVWNPNTRRWDVGALPVKFVGLGRAHDTEWTYDHGWRFGPVGPEGRVAMMFGLAAGKGEKGGPFVFDGKAWVEQPDRLNGLVDNGSNRIWGVNPGLVGNTDAGVRLRDLDRDGQVEVILGNPKESTVFGWSDREKRWTRLPFGLPPGARVVGEKGLDAGLRFVDLDEDGRDDVVFSGPDGFGVYLFDSMEAGWSRKVAAGKPGDPGAIPMIVRQDPRSAQKADTSNGGFWVHSRHLWWQNEDTAALPDLVDRRSFNDLLKDVTPRGKSAEAAVGAIRVRPGFRVELMASEPLVLDPIAFDWSADGRLWVVEMGDYPLGVDGKGKPGGQVRVLEDTDKDGRYDKVTLFLDGLGFPTGLIPWRNGVILASAPEIFYAEDRDGDGKADVHEVLFTGFNPGNQQHRLNGFDLGLDGWLYGANGDSGGVVRSVKTGKTVDIRGRDFRFRPETGEFEAESGQTQYGRHRDDWGRWFGDNNPNWAWHYVLSDADLRRNPLFAPPDPKRYLETDNRLYPVSRTVPRFNDPGAANRVTSANSPTPYRDDLFGPHFATSLFVSEPVHNLVHRTVLDPEGPTLIGRRAAGESQGEFLASSDAWFRPTMLKTGPDGALWVADMDRAVIEHPQWIPDDWEKRLDLRAGSDRGRIIRVVPVDKAPRPIPRLDTLDTAGLVAALDSPNGWQRDTAHRLLLHKADPNAAEPLRRLATTTRNPKARVQALWVLENFGALTAGPVLAALDDPHPQVRRNAVRVSERLLSTSPELAEAVLKRADDDDQAVRLQLALSLGNWPDPRAGGALARIARRDGSNVWSRAAVMSSAPAHVAALLTALFAGEGGPPPAGVVEPLFTLAGAAKDRAGLRALVGAVGTPAGQGGRFAAWQFSALSGLLDAAARARKTLDRWVEGDPDLTAAVARLDALWPAARATAADPGAADPERLAAVALLGREPAQRDAERALLAELLKPQVPVGVQVAAVAAVARGRDPKLPEPLLAGWKAYSPAVRAAVLDTLLSRGDWTGALLSSLEDTCTPPGEIDPAHRRQLVGHADKVLRDRAAAVFGPEGGSRQAVVETYREALNRPGDPAAGATVFGRVCVACHKLAGAGQDVGPDLAALEDRSPEALLVAVLDPSRAFEAKFTEYTVHLADGRVRTGMIASETASAITLRRQQGEQDVILRTDVEAMTASGKSLMPEGLEKDITPRDLADLIAYLTSASPAPAPKTLAGNRPEVVEPAQDGTIVLTAEAAEVYGDRLTFEPKYGNLGSWTADNDRASWRFTASRAGRYMVWFDRACAAEAAGQRLVVRSGGESFTIRVDSTGSWDRYRNSKVGELTLPAGPGRLEIRPDGALRGPLIDLRAVELRPVPEPCCEPGG